MLYLSAGSMWLWAVTTVPYQSDKVDETNTEEKDFNGTRKKTGLGISKIYQEGESLLEDRGSAIDYVEDSAFCGEKMDQTSNSQNRRSIWLIQSLLQCQSTI